MGVPLPCLLLLSVLFLALADNSTSKEDGIRSEAAGHYHRDLVKRINGRRGSWTARYNRFADTKEDVHGSDLSLFSAQTVHQFLSAPQPQTLHETEKQFRHLAELNISIPREFDVRKRWPHCWTVHQIFNQGPCGSCWAIASASVMSDRLCIASNGTVQRLMSAQDMISCCPFCGGCKGSIRTLSPFTYWKTHGVVSGGPYGSHEGCRPYSFEPHCGSPCSVPKYSKTPAPACQRQCQSQYDRSYQEDLYKGKSAYWLRAWVLGPHVDEVRNVLGNLTEEYAGQSNHDLFYIRLIQKEILLNGPVLACSAIFEEFQHYERGIYRHLEGDDEMYGHCVKLLGWGEENDQKYWIYANTWGRDWGEHGFFRVNLFDLPEEVVAGLPAL